MTDLTPQARWDARYAASDDYVFGTAPNAFLAAEASRIATGARVLSVADGEGRNGVFLASVGAQVHAVDFSAPALAKAKRLADARGVSVTFEQVDLLNWAWPVAAYDAVAAIFVQFVSAEARPAFFANIVRSLRPGGLLLLQGYRPKQLDYATGGPNDAANCYTEELLRASFAALRIDALRSYDAVISEGSGHSGMSALIELVASKPAD